MSIFENANRKVEKHNYGMNSKFDRFGRRIIDLPEKQEPVTEDITAKIIQGPDTIKPDISEGERAYRETKVQNAINYNTKTNIMKDMYSKILDNVLENVLCSIYYDALYLDNDFKEYNSGAITESVHEFLDEHGGYKYITEGYNRTKSPLLKSIMDICEETAREISDRKIKECNEKGNDKQSLDDIKIFDMTDDEKEKLDYNKDAIGIDKISSLIKDKVLNVVKDEKKREAEHVELIEEIENQLSEDENVNDEKAVAEALSSIFVKNTNIEEGTLFNSMLRNKYKNVLESGYDSLTLSKLDVGSDLNDLLNKVTLESILYENEIVDPKGKLITPEVKDVFNLFMDRLEREKDLGNTDTDALLESFAQCENKFYEVANSKITKTELKALRRDFELLRETFNEFLSVEENVAVNAVNKVSDKVDTAFVNALYKNIIKRIKDPKVLREQIERDKNIIKVCEKELNDRSQLDETKLQKILNNIKKSFYYSQNAAEITKHIQAGEKNSAENIDDKSLRKLIKYGKLYIKLAEKRIDEMESGNGKKSVKESYDSIGFIDVVDIVEECGFIIDDDLYDTIEEGLSDVFNEKLDANNTVMYTKSLKRFTKISDLEELKRQNDELYKKYKTEMDKRMDDTKALEIIKAIKNITVHSIPVFGPSITANSPQHSPKTILRRYMRNNRICDKCIKERIKELKTDTKTIKESYDYFDIDDFDAIEEKNIITNNKFVDSIKDKFTPPGKKKDKNKKDEKIKATEEGVECDGAGGCGNTTKEGIDYEVKDNKKVKKIDTAFDMDEKVEIKEEYYEFFDIDDEFDISEESLSKSENYKFIGKNLGTIILNSIKRRKDINNIHGGLLKIVSRCSSVNEVEYLQKDLHLSKSLLNKKMEQCKTEEERKQIKQHIQWINTEYSKALSAKKKELKAKEATKNKSVKEACSDILYECINIIDKKLELHEASDLNMAREVCVRDEYYKNPTVIPIINKKDIQLEGLDLPYKMKHVLESLTNILTGISNDDRTTIVSDALITNKRNVNAILESCKSIPSIPVYKINFLNSFNEMLYNLTETTNEIAEANSLINFKEYDDSFLDMYEDDYTYKVLTESVNDFDVNASDEFIDMDFVLADTIASYTLLETMYTLQLENPNHNYMKNITAKLLNR